MTDARFEWAALAVAAAAAVAAAVTRLALRRRAAAAAPRPAPRRNVYCDCGQEFVVTGTDRHRVYWLAGADESDPVLGDRCPVCDAPLPAEHAPAIV